MVIDPNCSALIYSKNKSEIETVLKLLEEDIPYHISSSVKEFDKALNVKQYTLIVYHVASGQLTIEKSLHNTHIPVLVITNSFDKITSLSSIAHVDFIAATDPSELIKFRINKLIEAHQEVDLKEHLEQESRELKKVLKTSVKDFIQQHHELSSKEKQLSSIINNISDVIFQLSADGKYSYISNNILSVGGYSSHEIVGKEFSQFVPKQERSRVQILLQKILGGQPVSNFRIEFLKKNGKSITIDINGTPLTKDKEIIGVQGLIRDVTESVHTERQLLASKQRFSNLIDSAYDPILTLNENGTISNYNPAFGKLVKRTKLLGVKFLSLKLVASESVEVFESTFNKTIQGFKLKPKRITTLDKSKKERQFEISCSLVRHTSKNNEVQIIFRDVTNYVKTLNKVQQEEEKLKGYFNRMEKGICVVDNDDRVIDINAKFTKITGFSKTDIVGKIANKILLSKITENELSDIMSLRKKGKSSSYETKLQRKNGSHMWARIHGSPLYDSSKEVIGSIGIIEDISEEINEFKEKERYSSLMETAQKLSKIGHREYNFHTNEHSGSDELYRILKLKPDSKNNIYDQLLHLVHPEDLDYVYNTFSKSIKNNEDYQIRYRLLFPDGEIKSIQEKCAYFLDTKGQPEKLISVIQDVTSQVSIIENARKYTLLVEKGPYLVIITNKDKKIEFINQNMEKTSGYTLEEVKGKNPSIFGSGQTQYKTYNTLWKNLYKGIPGSGKMINRAKDGKLFHVNSFITPIFNDRGVLTHYISLGEDITEIHNSEKISREKDAINKAILKTLPDAILLFNSDGEIIEANDNLNIFGIEEKVIGKNLKDIFPLIIYNGLIRYGTKFKRNSFEVFEFNHSVDGIVKTFEGRLSLSFKDHTLLVIRDISSIKEVQDELLNSKEHFKGIIENSSEITCITDEMGIIKYLSPSVEGVLGYTPGEKIGTLLFEDIHPEDKVMAQETFRERVTKGGTGNYRILRLKHKNGTYRSLRTKSTNQLHNPYLKGYIINSQDVTDMVHTQNILMEREEQLSLITENIDELVYKTSLGEQGEKIINYISPQSHSILNISPYEFMQSPSIFRNNIHPDDYHLLDEAENDVQENKEVALIEYRFKRKGAEGYIWLEESIVPYFDQDKNYAGNIGTIRNISLRKISEEALIRSESKNKTILNSIPDILFIMNKDGQYLDALVGEEVKLRQQNGELIGKHVDDILPKEIADKQLKSLRKVQRTGKPETIEYELIEDNVSSYYETRFVKSTNTEILKIVRDITEKRKAALIKEITYKIAQEANKSTIDLIALASYIYSSINKIKNYPNFYIAIEKDGKTTYPIYVGNNNVSKKPSSRTKSTVLAKSVTRNQTPLFLNQKEFKKYVNKEGIEIQNKLPNSFISVPLDDKGSIKGVVCAQSFNKETPLDIEDFELMKFITSQLGNLLERQYWYNTIIHNEIYFRSLTENSSEFILILNAKGIITYMSKSFENTFDIDTNDTINTSIFDYFIPSRKKELKQVFRDWKKQPGTSESKEIDIKLKNGTSITLETYCNNMLDDSVVRGMIINAYDITEKKHANQELLEKKNSLEIIHAFDQDILAAKSTHEIISTALRRYFEFDIPIQRISIVLYDTDKQLAYSYAKRVDEESLRYNEFELNESPYYKKLIKGETVKVNNLKKRKKWTAVTEGIYNAGVRAFLSYPLTINKQCIGSINIGFQNPGYPVHLHEETSKSMADQVSLAINSSRLSEDVARNVSRFKSVYEQSAIGIAEVSLDGVFTHVNRKLVEILGYSGDELLGLTIKDVTHPNDWPNSAKVMDDMNKGITKKTDLYKQYVRKDGSVIDAHIWISRIQSTVDVSDYYIAMVEDITDAKRAEELAEQVFVATATVTGLQHFKQSSKFLCDSLGMKYALIGEFKGDTNKIETISFYSDGKHVENITYDLKHTPCENVIGKRLCIYERNVANLFPLDVDLKKMNAESYVGVPLFDEQNQPIGLIALMDDKPIEKVKTVEIILSVMAPRTASELKRLNFEKALTESEEKFRELTETINGVFYLIDWKEKKPLYVSPSYEAIFNQPTSQYMENHMSKEESIHPDDRSMVSEQFRTYAELGLFNAEYRITLEDGRIKWIHERAFPILDKENNVIRMAGFCNDITERKNEEAFINEQNSSLESIIKQSSLNDILKSTVSNTNNYFGNAISTIHLTTDNTDQLKLANSESYKDSFMELLNVLKPSEKVGSIGAAALKKSINITTDISRNKSWKIYKEELEEISIKSSWSVPILSSEEELYGVYTLFFKEYRRPSEKEVTYLEAAANMVSVAIESDLSRKNASRINERLEKMVSERTSELMMEIDRRISIEDQLNIAKEHADSANQAKTKFLANMSHEIRSPLNAIVGFSEILMKKGQSGEYPIEFLTFLRNIKSSGENLSLIINDILDLSKIEAGKIGYSPELTNLNQLIKTVYQINKAAATEKNIQFSYNIASNVPNNVVTDRTKLIQVLINLLSNAIKFTPEKKRVEFNVSCNDELLSFTVKDEGIGIEKSRLESIFDPFEQEDTSTTREFGGTGLGLTIVQKFAELFGGKITVESEKNKGSEFVFSIPYLESDQEIQELHEDSISLKNFSIPKGFKIIAAEDNLMNQKMLRALFDELETPIKIAADGEELIKLMEKEKPDLILMDVHMPNMDGIEATKTIRNQGNKIPIIGLSADAFVEAKQNALDAGMNQYITKPIDIHKLINGIDQFIKRPKRKASEPVKKKSKKLDSGKISSTIATIKSTPIYQTEDLIEQFFQLSTLLSGMESVALNKLNDAIYSGDEEQLTEYCDQVLKELKLFE